MSRALVVGCGYVGRALAERLLADGVEVWALRRHAQPVGDSLRWIHADASDGAGLCAAVEPLAASREPLDVYYLVSADGFSDEAYRRAYVDGLESVLAALSRAPLRRVLFASSTAVYGQSDGSWVDEESPTEPEGFSGRRLLEGEALLAAAPVESVTLRYGGIYGPGRTRLIDAIVGGKAIAAPGEPQYRSRMHRDDCAAAMLHLSRLAQPEACYVAVDDEPSDQRDVQAWLCDELGVDEEGLTPASGSRRGGNKRCRNARLRATGLSLRYPTYREGYGALLDELGLR